MAFDKRYEESYRNQDPVATASLYTEDCTVLSSTGQLVQGREGWFVSYSRHVFFFTIFIVGECMALCRDVKVGLHVYFSRLNVVGASVSERGVRKIKYKLMAL